MHPKLFLLALAFILAFQSGFSQRVYYKKDKTIIEVLSPPNGVHLYDNVFMDETEIANIHYIEYLYYLSKDSTEECYNSQLPDPDAWEIKLQPKDSVDSNLENYFRHPRFRYFPVIGVSHEQARQYCIWRTRIVNDLLQQQMREKRFMRKHPSLKDYIVSVEFRLPTKAEWEYAAGKSQGGELPFGTRLPWSKRSIKVVDVCGCEDCLAQNNIEVIDKKARIFKTEFNVADDYYFASGEAVICKKTRTPAPTYIYDGPPNVRRLYGMIGNVAEMVDEEGIAKGGSFRSRLSDITIEKDFPYGEAGEWLGFRCVAIVHIRKK